MAYSIHTKWVEFMEYKWNTKQGKKKIVIKCRFCYIHEIIEAQIIEKSDFKNNGGPYLSRRSWWQVGIQIARINVQQWL